MNYFGRKSLLLAITGSISFCSSMVLAQEDGQVIEEITVTGSYLQRPQGDEASPIKTLSASDLSSQGNVSIADIFLQLPSVSGSEIQSNIFRQNFSAGTAPINLRGLGLNSTLVLIDGRRVTQSAAYGQDGSSFVDLNTIPTVMLDRVEILKDGAAATYGSDAVAGVVNFITRKNFEGFEINAAYQTTENGPQDDIEIGFIAGKTFGVTNAVFGFNYFTRDSLPATDRSFTDPDVAGQGFSAAGQPGNYIVVGLQGPQPDPECEAAGGFIRAGGPPCKFNYIEFNELFVPENRLQAILSITHELGDTTELYGSLLIARNKVNGQTLPPSLPTVITPDAEGPAIRANHPNNPFGSDINVAIARPFGANSTPGIINRDNDTDRLTLGVKGETGKWGYDVAYQYSRNEYSFNFPDVRRSRLRAAYLGLGGPNNNEFFNPFGLSDNNSQSVIDDIKADAFVDGEADLHTIDFVVSTEFGELKGGSISLAMGAQWRQESLDVDYSNDFENFDLTFLIGADDYNAKRNVYSAFAEVLFPFNNTFEATLAARYEDYEGFGSSFDPKIALRWQPNETLVVRASASTAFRTPTLLQAFGNFAAVNDFLDENGSFQFRADLASGNPDLENEESTTFNIGLVLTPTDNFTLGIDYWNFKYDNVITKQNANSLLVNAGGPSACADPNPSNDLLCIGGVFTAVNTNFFNAATSDTDGIDISVQYAVDTTNGTFGLHADITTTLSFDIQESRNGPVINALGTRNFFNFARSNQELKGSVKWFWNTEKHDASLTLRYVDDYINDGLPNPVPIDDHTTLDFQYGYSFQSGLSLTGGVINLMDKEPPFVNTNFGFDTQTHDPRGRIFYVRMKMSFQ